MSIHFELLLSSYKNFHFTGKAFHKTWLKEFIPVPPQHHQWGWSVMHGLQSTSWTSLEGFGKDQTELCMLQILFHWS